MFRFGEKHPVLFEFILIAAAFLAAALFIAAGSLFYLPSDLSAAAGRIITGVILMLIYRRAFIGDNPLANPVIVIPALLFAVWNIFYNLSSGMEFGGPGYVKEGLITAMAPAIFEEVLFRGIFIYNLKKKGYGSRKCMFISAAVFSLIHITNLAGRDIAGVALQVVYSFVVGMVFAAVYLTNNSISQVMIVHFLTDFTNRIFYKQSSSASVPQLIIFGLLLASEAIYALKLTMPGRETAEE